MSQTVPSHTIPFFDAATKAEAEQLLALSRTDRLAETLKAAQQLTQRLPSYYLGWKILGVALHAQGALTAAADAMQQAVACRPDDLEARYNLGCVLWRLGRFNLAFVQSAAILQQVPQHAKGLSLYAMVLAAQQRMDDARIAFEQALSVDPNQLAAQDGLGHVLMAAGELPAAAAHFRQALALRLLQPLAPLQLATPSLSFDQTAHYELLWLTLTGLATAGVQAFPFAGTLLGLEREGRLLSFDKDFDFALPFEQLETACAYLAATGWVAEPRLMRLINPCSFRHGVTGVVLDLCSLRTEGDLLIGGFWQEGTPEAWQRHTEFPAPFALQRQAGPYGDYWVLAQPDIWLTALYGDWRKPDPEFDTVISAYNLRGFSLLTECFALNRINHAWGEGRWGKVSSLLTHSLRQLPEDRLLLQAQQQVVQHVTQLSRHPL